VNVAHWAATVLYNGLARYPEAMGAARADPDVRNPGIATWILPELVEAATRAGEPDVARDAVERFLATTRPFTTDFAAGYAARTRALVADGSEADALHREAIERFGRTRLRLDAFAERARREL
jgi:hypothetical protein